MNLPLPIITQPSKVFPSKIEVYSVDEIFFVRKGHSLMLIVNPASLMRAVQKQLALIRCYKRSTWIPERAWENAVQLQHFIISSRGEFVKITRCQRLLHQFIMVMKVIFAT